jgi:hypothetical protein
MLTEAEAHHMAKWIVVARHWGESSQGMVGASTDFSMRSRELADRIQEGSDPLPGGTTREELSRELRMLADVVEAQTLILREDYLATAASLDALGSVIELRPSGSSEV